MDVDGERILVRGLIDRIDVDAGGRLRIIDYKSAGKGNAHYSAKALERGDKIQLPIYALAARDALYLGEPVEGFYWHVPQGEPSALRLAAVGPEIAFQQARDQALRTVLGVRRAPVRPRFPRAAVPGYYPAAPFCWRYDPRGYG